MALTQDEAEKLARKTIVVIKRDLDQENLDWQDVKRLCGHILSGDMKREIENAAYERVEEIVHRKVGNFFDREETRAAIRSLIQPPAQKEDGE